MYMYIYFEIFALLVEEKNLINSEKCSKMHEYDWLLEILENSFYCWPL